MMHRGEEVNSCCFQSLVLFVCEERLGKPTTRFDLWLGIEGGISRMRTNYRCLTPPSCTSIFRTWDGLSAVFVVAKC
jgi:non-canonical (house-cleaning) NTP pyrophosphatase